MLTGIALCIKDIKRNEKHFTHLNIHLYGKYSLGSVEENLMQINKNQLNVAGERMMTTRASLT